MSSVYRSSGDNVTASMAKDGSEGLWSHRNPNTSPSLQVCIKEEALGVVSESRSRSELASELAKVVLCPALFWDIVQACAKRPALQLHYPFTTYAARVGLSRTNHQLCTSRRSYFGNAGKRWHMKHSIPFSSSISLHKGQRQSIKKESPETLACCGTNLHYIETYIPERQTYCNG